jgi:hypothetical protein
MTRNLTRLLTRNLTRSLSPGGVTLENTVAPAVTGFAYPQETLTCSTGTWTGEPTFAYQGYVNGTLRSGAPSSTFQPLLTDIGLVIRCDVTATLGSQIVTQASGNVTCWHPDDIAGVVRFWTSRANVLNSVSPDVAATDGQTVRRWNEVISSTAADQTTGVSQPIYRATGESSGPSLEFDGSNDSFSLPGTSDVLQNRTQAYLIAGCRDTTPTAGTDSHAVIYYSVNAGAGPRLALWTRFFTSNIFSAQARRQDADAATRADATSNSNYNVLAAHGDYSNGFVRLRVNGSVSASTALASGSGSTQNSTSLIANIGVQASGFFPGHLTAVCVANQTLSATDLSRIERYIGLMGGLNIALV